MTNGLVEWPVDLRGVTESIVTTLGPNDRWNVAALGLHAPPVAGSDAGTDVAGSGSSDLPVTATTWGRTRTWRNFAARGEGYVQFTRDPVDFVEAALTVREEDEPVLGSADAWCRVEVDRRDAGEEEGTQWVEWELRPVEVSVEREVVPTVNRGFNAVVEATVAASRLEVPAYDTDVLVDRLAHLESVVERCGGERDREAFALLTGRVDAEW